MECLVGNQQDLVVVSEFYRRTMEGRKNRGNMAGFG